MVSAKVVSAQTETVDAALHAEDFAPLVRLVFDALSASLTTNTTKAALLTRPTVANPALEALDEEEGDGDAAAGRRASDRSKTMRKQAAAPLIAALEQVLDSKSAELSQICRGNAEEIVSSLQELEAMQAISHSLREHMTESDAVLRETGGSFMGGLEQLQDLNRVGNAVADSCQAVGSCRQLLSLCAQAGRAVNSDELYKAFCLLERAEKEFLADDADAEAAALGRRKDAEQKLSKDVRLHSFLRSKIQEMQTAIQQKAVSDFNNWLVSARREAKPIGEMSLTRAAWHRNREESLAQQRSRLASNISQAQDLDEAAVQLAMPLAKNSPGDVKLDPKVHPIATELLAAGKVDPAQDIMVSIVMTPLHRCLMIHSCLGRVSTFKEYYQINRRTQLNNDLAANMNFVKQYKAYIFQIVGFFVIEDRVARATDAMSGQIDAGWETAVAYMKLALQSAFPIITDASIILDIKDMLLLACSALGACGYHVAPLHDLLVMAKTLYYELLNKALQPTIDDIVEEHGRNACVVTSAPRAVECSATLGLPLTNNYCDRDSMGAQPPFTAPFSEALPQILSLSRKYVDDIVAYAWGVTSQAEMLATVSLQRDTMLIQLPLAALERQFAETPLGLPHALSYVLQGTADLHLLEVALTSLEDYTYYKVRGAPPSRRHREIASQGSNVADAMERPAASLGSSQGTAVTQQTARSNYTCLSHAHSHHGGRHKHHHHHHHSSYRASGGLIQKMSELIALGDEKLHQVFDRRIKTIVKNNSLEDWEPEAPIRHADTHSPLQEALVRYFQDACALMHQHTPGECSWRNIQVLVHTIGQAVLGMLLSDDVEDFNIYAVFSIMDDALSIANVVAKTGVPNLEEELQELIQTCEVLATGQVEKVLDPVMKEEKFPAVDLKRLQVILRKFREVRVKTAGHGIANHLHRFVQPDSFLKKKAVEKVLKLLRIQADTSKTAK